MNDPVEIGSHQAILEPMMGGQLPDGQRLYIQGLLALRDGAVDAAVELLRAGLEAQPSHQGMRRNLVRALMAAGRFDETLTQADICLAVTPDDAELHFARGSAFSGLGGSTMACAALTRATTLRPGHAPSWLNLANAWADLDDLQTAEDLCRRAIGLDPDLTEAHASLGYILTARGQLPAAIAACETSIGLSPDFTQAHWNLAIGALLSGNLERGFAEYEWRKRHLLYGRNFAPLPGPQWDGSDPGGRTILVRAEQGFGDMIQFARYLSMIREAGGSPVFACAPVMAPLIRSICGVRVVSCDHALPAYDCWIDQMSLPHIFGTTLETIPSAEGYLRADPERIEAWEKRLPAGRKIGLAFIGNPAHRNDRRRSIPPEMGRTLLGIPGITFVNLHHGAFAAEVGLPDLSACLTDYAETAALVANLDLVVTVDTSIAHLAGALGKPAWVLLPAAPDWRWLLGREDSVWYASLRLLRQENAGDWTGVLARVMHEIPDFLQSPTAF